MVVLVCVTCAHGVDHDQQQEHEGQQHRQSNDAYVHRVLVQPDAVLERVQVGRVVPEKRVESRRGVVEPLVLVPVG